MPQSPLDDVRSQVSKVGDDISDAFSFKNQRQKIWSGIRNLYGSAPKPAPVQAAESDAKKISSPIIATNAKITAKIPPVKKAQFLKR